MSDEVNYVENWEDKATQCQSCKSFQQREGKSACVPEDKSFEQALSEYGEVSPTGHCNYFKSK